MADPNGIYAQFALRFPTQEAMDAYKQGLLAGRELPQDTEILPPQMDLQLLASDKKEAPVQPTTDPKLSSLRPAIAPNPADERSKTFSTIHQGTVTNAFTKMISKDSEALTVDRITGDATIKRGNFSITLTNFADITGLRGTAHQLFDAIGVAFTESGGKSPVVTISLEEYMKLRGLKDRKEAKAQARDDLKTLLKSSFTGEETRGNEILSYDGINYFERTKLHRNGLIEVSFTNSFYGVLLSYPVMPLPNQIFKLNSKRNPNSYYLLRKISEHKNMNVGKKNEDTISVKTLLGVAPYIPSYAEVMKSGKHIDQRIIKPFERDMDALADTLSWHYCHSNNVPLTDEEQQSLTYDNFVKLMVHTEWNYYPDQTARLERKQERIEEAKEKKKRSPSKRKKPAKTEEQ